MPVDRDVVRNFVRGGSGGRGGVDERVCTGSQNFNMKKRKLLTL